MYLVIILLQNIINLKSFYIFLSLCLVNYFGKVDLFHRMQIRKFLHREHRSKDYTISINAVIMGLVPRTKAKDLFI